MSESQNLSCVMVFLHFSGDELNCYKFMNLIEKLIIGQGGKAFFKP